MPAARCMIVINTQQIDIAELSMTLVRGVAVKQRAASTHWRSASKSTSVNLPAGFGHKLEFSIA
jgi:hypothetical protein